MTAVDKFSKHLAEALLKKASAPESIGRRLIVKGFPDAVLEKGADVLALLARNGSMPQPKAENVVYVLTKSEYPQLAEREQTHAANQVGLSYCTNIRDKGETAVFFVRKALAPLVDESLKDKGSLYAEDWGITPRKVLTETVDDWIAELNWADQGIPDFGDIRELVLERCRGLLNDERSAPSCFEALDRFFALSPDLVPSPAGYKALGLVPMISILDDSLAENVAQIDRLRGALANPEKRSGYVSNHKEYDPDVYQQLDKFLDEKGWRVPLETKDGGKPYLKFFIDWPNACTLAFLQCAEKGPARLDVSTMTSTSGREFQKLGAVFIVDEDQAELKWRALDLAGCQGEIVIGEQRLTLVPLLEGNASTVDMETPSPVLRQQQLRLKVRPANSRNRRRLKKDSRNTLDFVRLAPAGKQALILLGKSLVIVVREEETERRCAMTPPRSGSLAIQGVLYDGCSSVGEVEIRDDQTGEIRDSVSAEKETSVFLKITWGGKPEPFILEIAWEESETEEPKVKDCLLNALRDARNQIERFGERLDVSEEWQGQSYFTVRCAQSPEFAADYEARRQWTDELLDKVLATPEIFQARCMSLDEGEVLVADQPLNTSEGVQWPDPWQAAESDAFAEKRKVLFAELRKRGRAIPFMRLSEMRGLILEYADSYLRILKRYRESQATFDPSVAWHSVIDVFLPLAKKDYADGKASEVALRTKLFVLAPTHPIRLLWLLLREELSLELIASASGEYALHFLEALNGMGYPSSLALPDQHVLASLFNPCFGFWGVYMPEALPHDKAINAFAKLFPREAADLENPLIPDPRKICQALEYSHRAMPYRDTLRISYSNPGSAQCLCEALKRIPRSDQEFGDLHRVLFDKKMTRFRVDLVSDEPSGVGTAFGESYRESREDSQADSQDNLPDRLEVQCVMPGERRSSDLSFADDVATREPGALLQIARCPDVLPIGGLVCPWVGRSKLNRNATGQMLAGFVHPSTVKPPGSTGEENAGRLLGEVLFEHQALFAQPSVGVPLAGTDQSARAFSVKYEQSTLELVRKMQGMTNFLFTLDTNADLAMFEAMAANGESIIIDFDPAYHNPVARAFDSTGHNYVVTVSARESPVKKRLKSEVARLGTGDDQLDRGSDKLFAALNGLSGRFLKEMLQRSVDIRETIGAGLASLLVQKEIAAATAASALARIASVVIPVDDHFDRWFALAGRARIRGQQLRSDLLLLTVHLADDGRLLRIWPRILEAKFGYHDQDNAAAEKGAAQVVNTWHVLKEAMNLELASCKDLLAVFRFGGGAERMFRLLDLASVIDFHLRRAARLSPPLVSTIGSGMELEAFANMAYSLIVSGRAEIVHEICSGASEPSEENHDSGLLVGNVLHFDPDAENDAPGAEPKGLGPVVYCRRYGKPMCRELIWG